MAAGTVLSLPIDIPWKRRCVSADMIDPAVCDRVFPFRWRSSLAVFSYEPPDVDQTLDDITITYLKVTCTITGFQPDPKEIGLDNRRLDSLFNDPKTIANYKDVASKYYGCYGAVLEVAVGPPKVPAREIVVGRGSPDTSHYPYFMDFEPKKRELYESVTESGEVMSRSLEDVNVHKGNTTSESHEKLDVFGGVSAGLGASFGAGGITGGANTTGSNQGQKGTIDISQAEYTNLRTTDQARENRETSSHTTQLTQMYHQFTGYHLGTNRAVFFMLPRPHIIQSDLTFVNGPRQLEGIQDVFLIVARPKGDPEFCVEAYLETGHIATNAIYDFERKTDTAEMHLFVPAPAENDSTVSTGLQKQFYLPPPGWVIDSDHAGGFTVQTEHDGILEQAGVSKVPANFDELVIEGSVAAHRDKDGNATAGRLDIVVTVFLRKDGEPILVGFDKTQTLFITGRGVCCCPHDDPRSVIVPDFVVWERDLANVATTAVASFDRMPAQDANRVRSWVGQQMLESRHHYDRYSAGAVRFVDTNFVARNLANTINSPQHPDNIGVSDFPALNRDLQRKVAQLSPTATRASILALPLSAQQNRLGLSFEEALQLRRGALGLGATEPTRPARSTVRSVPDLTGVHFRDARQRLAQAGLSIGLVKREDSSLPCDSVVGQVPHPGVEVIPGTSVNLQLATGAVVCIPAILGLRLSDGLERLRTVGLESEPEIECVASDLPKSTIAAVTPKPGKHVTPQASVVLRISQGPAAKGKKR